MTPEKLAELRKIAEAATPGPWRIMDEIIQYFYDSPEYGYTNQWHDLGKYYGPRDVIKFWNIDANFIATFNPKLVLELLAELEKLKEECLTWHRNSRPG